MRHFIVLLYLFSSLTLIAQDNERELTEELFTTRDPEKFPALLTKGQKSKIAPQVILEAQFLYYVDAHDYQALAKLAPQLRATEFSSEISEIFSLEDDWLAIIKYCEALHALQQNDAASFRNLITEAFWHSPRQASAFAPHIEKLKMAEAMKRITLDKTVKLDNLLDGNKTQLIQPNKVATLLYFWSPWSREFDETIEDFELTNQAAIKNNFSVISALAETSPEMKTDALTYIDEQKLSNKYHWCIAPLNLQTQLRVQNIPTVILINYQGKILFNGHPSDPDFWKSIQTIAPKFTQPTLTEPQSNNF